MKITREPFTSNQFVFWFVVACATAALISECRAGKQTPDVPEAKAAMIYACGYVRGQRDQSHAMGKPVDRISILDECEEYRRIARDNGFDRDAKK